MGFNYLKNLITGKEAQYAGCDDYFCSRSRDTGDYYVNNGMKSYAAQQGYKREHIDKLSDPVMNRGIGKHRNPQHHSNIKGKKDSMFAVLFFNADCQDTRKKRKKC